jgi:hypothetical protein
VGEVESTVTRGTSPVFILLGIGARWYISGKVAVRQAAGSGNDNRVNIVSSESNGDEGSAAEVWRTSGNDNGAGNSR